MPQFIMLLGDNRVQVAERAVTFESLDAFTQGYVEAMFFTDASTPDDGDLQDATFADLAPETLARIISDCEQFQTANAALLDHAYVRDYDAMQAGRDYWFTRNGHGVGFWSREQLEPDSAEYESLTAEMVANRDNNAVWGAALAKRKALSQESIGERLATAARYSSVDLYRGDDGKLYI